MMIWKRIIDNLSLKAVRQRLDRRKLQEELDLHRLYLVTSYQSQFKKAQGHVPDDIATQLSTRAQSLGIDGMKEEINIQLTQQLTSISNTLHSILLTKHDAHASKFFSNILEQDQNNQKLSSSHSTHTSPLPDDPTLSTKQVANLFLDKHRFSLYSAPSSIQDDQAGNGVWLKGKADIGQIVALYPGVAYSPLHYRDIPGYPLVARTNPYLISRFDGIVVDAQPWLYFSPSYKVNNSAELFASYLEQRHPLAYAHLANHPPKDVEPNVVIAPIEYDVEKMPHHLRAYFPVVSYSKNEKEREREQQQEEDDEEEEERRQYSLLTFFQQPRKKTAIDAPRKNKNKIPGIALVAVRPLNDEELFLNYRLNPHTPTGLPPWYHSVDPEEDARRWAQ